MHKLVERTQRGSQSKVESKLNSVNEAHDEKPVVNSNASPKSNEERRAILEAAHKEATSRSGHECKLAYEEVGEPKDSDKH